MEAWLDFARGPLLRFALLVMFLGLARHVFLAGWGLVEAIHKAQDKNIPYGAIVLRTVSWLVPVGRLHRNRLLNSVTSFAFHGGLLLSALFLQEHIELWEQGLGIRWWAFPRSVVDVLTLLTIFTGLALLLYRIYARNTRFISRPGDYLLLLLLLVPFITGFLAGRSWNPISYDLTILIHVLSGAAIFMVLPFTKLAHCVLFPLIRICSEVGWHFPAQGGTEVVKTLTGTETRPI